VRALRSVVIERDEAGQVKLPVCLGQKLTLVELGR
jgi:hypothetical protein